MRILFPPPLEGMLLHIMLRFSFLLLLNFQKIILPPQKLSNYMHEYVKKYNLVNLEHSDYVS